jgi:glycine hydroxymethyltransferase
MKDKQIKKLIEQEEKRSKSVVNLIASENFVSKDVLAALGSVLTNKYSEGYSGARFYAGNEIIDQIENLAIERALKVFKLKKKDWHVNVQALSGSPANLAVISGIVPAGEKIMGMKLSAGGHLTHGHIASFTGKMWKQVGFGVHPISGLINYEEVKNLAVTEKPKMIICGFTAYPRLVDFAKFREIADACGAHLHVDMSHFGGLVAGSAVPSPFPFADSVMTTTHKTLRGPRGAIIFTKKTTPTPFYKAGEENISEIKTIPTLTLPQGKGTEQQTPLSSSKRELEKWEKIDKAVFPGLQGGPHDNQTAGIAVALAEALDPKFKIYSKQVIKNAKVLSKELMKLGWKLSSDGTDTHLILMNTWMEGTGLSGQQASDVLAKNGIIVNKNALPGDTRGVVDPSGIRLGTAAETTRNKKEADMVKLAKKINDILRKEIIRLNSKK